MNSLLKYMSLVAFFGVLLVSCERDTELASEATLFELMSNDSLGINFVNEVLNSEDFNIFNYRNFYNGGGVGLGDINNDGLLDIFLSSNMGTNKLYLNKGDWKFEDISVSAGIEEAGKWSTGVVMIDINGDQLLDIYVCNAGFQEGTDQENALFINNGDLSFSNQAEAYGLNDGGYTTHAAFFDFDLDGDLDIYILNNSFIPVNTLNYSNMRELRAEDWDVKEFLKGGGDKLLRNEGNTFVDVSKEMGIYGSLIGFGLGVTVGDVNGDRYPDIYISNDFFERDYLYINQQGKKFSEELENRIDQISHSSMGADMADINNDGHPEIFVTDMLPDDEYRLKTTTSFDNINLRRLKLKQGFYNQFMHNTLQLNDGSGKFQEVSYYADVAASDWSWGALIFDADNDRYNDILVCNGIYHDVIDQDFIDFFANDVLQQMALSGKKEEMDSVINSMPSVPVKNKAFRNNSKFQFEDVSDEWGLTQETFSNGAAYGDLDNDGDLDLVINNLNQDLSVYKNNSDPQSYLGFELIGEGSNSLAIGSRIEIHYSNTVHMKELIPSRGFQSSVDTRMYFGFPDLRPDIDSIIVKWPTGMISIIENYEWNTLNTIEESLTPKLDLENADPKQTVFKEVDHGFDPHEEDDFIDFYYERNIPNQLSHEGPCSAIADVNNDGHVDIFIGGADGQSASLYLYSNGKYVKHQQDYFDKFKAMEDTAAKFFDADSDGDMDLIVGSGGNNVQYNPRAFTDRLYINTNGNFELKFNALPKESFNTSVFETFDYDGDGDLDLFIGTRSIPGYYGISPGSRILNNNGKALFMDVTKFVVPELLLAGMITDAKVADILDNKGEELIIVGEWMSPKVLAFNGQNFDIVSTEMDSLAGWWQSITAVDIDNDNDLDLVLGNIGQNFYMKADSENPLRMWINDYDQNNSMEKIITRTIDGKDMPIVMKRDLTDQLAILKKQNLKHSEYANKSIHELFPDSSLVRSTVKQINFLSSVVAINESKGKFRIQELPMEAQLSCVNEIVAVDYNKDGNQDLVLAGNNHYFLPQFSMLGSNKGQVFENNGNGSFKYVDNTRSGLDIKGVTRSLQLIEQNGEKYLLALRNDDKAKLYKLND